MIFLPRQYMKKVLLGIVILLLTATVFILLVWHFTPQAAEREYSGLFIMNDGTKHHGHLYKT